MTAVKFAALAPNTDRIDYWTVDRAQTGHTAVERSSPVMDLCIPLLRDLRVDLRVAATYDASRDECTVHLSHEDAVRVVTYAERSPSAIRRAIDAERALEGARTVAFLSHNAAERWREHERQEYARTWAERWGEWWLR